MEIPPKKAKTILKIVYFTSLCFLLNPKGRGLDPYLQSPVKRMVTRIVPGNNRSAVFLRIRGNVTGVNYESWLKRKALVNGLQCYISNWKGCFIFALLIGPGEIIELLVREAWKGPGRASVIKINELWFNKDVKSSDEGKKSAIEEQVSWSQETANLLKETMEILGPIMKLPNFFKEDGKFNNVGEIERAALDRNLYASRISNICYIASPGKRIGFQNSESSNVTSLLRLLTDHKQLTNDYLAQFGLPVPSGRMFTEYKEALAYLLASKKPMVVKPAIGSYGKGITVDVRTKKDLMTAWDYAKKYYEQVVLEELLYGVDIRVLVTGGKSCASLLRVPANVVGDGKSNVIKLIDVKNIERQNNPRLRKAPIVPDAYTESFLARQGHHYHSIPQYKEVVFLHLKANLEAGGDSVGVMDYINPDLLKMAEEAVAALGISDFWGIDMMVERIDLPRHMQRCGIIEVNARANIYNVQFPMYGKPADAAKALIDEMFPQEMLETDYPLITRQIQINGRFNPKFYSWLTETMQELLLQGEFRRNKAGTEILITGRQKNVLFFIDQLLDWQPHHSNIVDRLLLKEPGNLKEDNKSNNDADEIKEEKVSTHALGSSHVEQYAVNSFTDPVPGIVPGFDIDTGLFLKEFIQRGFEANPLYEDLIEIRKNNMIGLTGMRYSSSFADTACEKYFPARRLLALQGLPVTRGARFRLSKKRMARDYYLKSRFQKCLVTNLHPEEQEITIIDKESVLSKFWMKAKNSGSNYVYIEDIVKGCHVCVAVVKNYTAGALVLEPVSITGDGVSSIIELIEKKNAQRLKNPWYKDKLITVDKQLLKHLKRCGLEVENVLEDKMRLFLESAIVLERGGETISAGEFIHQDFNDKAVLAASALCGLEFAFIHMIVPYPDQPADGQHWVVLKVDTRPKVGMFHFPFKGKPINLTNAVVQELALTERVKWIKV